MSVLTADPLRRAAAPVSSRVYRVFVGPQERWIDAALFAAGEPVALPLETYLAAAVTFTPAPVEMTLKDATGLPDLPNALCLVSSAGASWFRYEGITGNVLNACTLIYGALHHEPGVGSIVTQWVEITQRVRVGSIGRQAGWDGEAEADWSFSIEGEHYDSDLMPEDSTVLVMESVKPIAQSGAGWSDFVVAALGYVRLWDSSGDAKRQRNWSATIQSVSTYVNTFQVGARTFGRVNLAEGASVTASPHLANPLDVLDEWQGAIGTTDADKLTNGLVDDGPYVSQVEPSTTVEAQGSSDSADPGVLFQEAFFGDDQDPTLQWFQLLLAEDSPHYTEQGVSLNNYAISNILTIFLESFGTYPDDHPDHPGDRWPKEIRSGANNYIRLKDITLTSDSDRVILTNNRARFLRRWNTQLPVVEWRELPGFGDDGLTGAGFVMDVGGDWLQLRYCATGLQTVKDMVAWGTLASGQYWTGSSDEYESGGQWNDGSHVVAPAAGESIRRFTVATDTNRHDDWIVESDPNPADRRDDTDNIYMAVELPDIPTALDGAITALSPAVDELFPLLFPEYLRLESPELVYLDIRVDTEQIRLRPQTDGTWKVGSRAINATTAAAHSDGATVFYSHSTLGFTRLPWVESVELRRWERFDTVTVMVGGVPLNRLVPRTPKVFEVWGSQEDAVAYPGEVNYRLDWLNGGHLVHHVNGGIDDAAFVMNVPLDRARPLRHVMIVGKRMMLDSTHWMTNELRVWRAGMSAAQTAYEGIGNVVYYYLRQLLDAARIVIDPDVFTGTSGDVTIQGGTLGSILDDLGKQYAFVRHYTRDNIVWLRKHPFHPLATRPALSGNIDARMIAGTLAPQHGTRPSRLGNQYVVALHDVDALRVYEGVYPPSAPFGEVRTIERVMRGGNLEEAARIAQMYYLTDPNTSRRLELTIPGVLPELEPLQRYLVFDYTDDAAYDGRWVDCLVIDVNLSGGRERVSLQEWRQI